MAGAKAVMTIPNHDQQGFPMALVKKKAAQGKEWLVALCLGERREAYSAILGVCALCSLQPRLKNAEPKQDLRARHTNNGKHGLHSWR